MVRPKRSKIYRVIDITWTLEKRMTAYKNIPGKQLKRRKTRTHEKHGVEESQLTMNSHTGTHIDAPKHFLRSGQTIDKIALNKLVGRAKVFSIRTRTITEREIRKLKISKGDIVLFKTRNSKKSVTARFNSNFVYLEKNGATALAKRGVKAVGIDYLGIETKQPRHETHKILLGKNIPIIEGLRLGQVKPGKYILVAVPLKIKNGDASPARAILLH